MEKNNIKNKFSFIFQLAIIFFISRLLLLAVAFVFYNVKGNNSSIFELFYHWDAGWYTSIVENGYAKIPFGHSDGNAANWAFFPLYPLIVRFFSNLSGLVPNEAGIIVSNIFIFLASIFAFLYTKETRQKESFLLPVLLFLGPWTFYFSCFYTEALFIFLVILCFYFCNKKCFLLAGLASACASATRSVGCFLFFVILIENYFSFCDKISIKNITLWIKHLLKKPSELCALLVSPLGIFCYMLFLYNLVGDAWAMKNIQIAWHNIFGNPFITIFNGLTSLRFFATFNAVLCIFFFTNGILLIKKRRFSEGIFLILNILLPCSSALTSIPRYLLGTFVAELVVYDILEKIALKNIKFLLVSISIILNMALVWYWFLGRNFLA